MKDLNELALQRRTEEGNNSKKIAVGMSAVVAEIETFIYNKAE